MTPEEPKRSETDRSNEPLEGFVIQGGPQDGRLVIRPEKPALPPVTEPVPTPPTDEEIRRRARENADARGGPIKLTEDDMKDAE